MGRATDFVGTRAGAGWGAAASALRPRVGTVAQGFDNRGRIEYAASVRFLFLARVLFALLAFQLGVGLQVGVAHAAAGAPATMHLVAHASNAATPDGACPLHSAPHAKAPAGKHDCCKSSGCQGQCGNALLAFDVSLARNSPASTCVQPISTERAVVAPADTHFRPPILS